MQDQDYEVIGKVKWKVTSVMNAHLLAPFRAEEVKKVLFSIVDMKARGPYELHVAFY